MSAHVHLTHVKNCSEFHKGMTEYCQKHCFDLTWAAPRQEGADHMPVFFVHAVVAGQPTEEEVH